MQGPLDWGLFTLSPISYSLLSNSFSIINAFGSRSEGGVLSAMDSSAIAASMGVKPYPALLFLSSAILVVLSIFSISFCYSKYFYPCGSYVMFFVGSMLLMLPSLFYRLPIDPIRGFLLFFRSRLTSIRGDHWLSRFRILSAPNVRLAWLVLVLVWKLAFAELSGFIWFLRAYSGFLMRLVNVWFWIVISSWLYVLCVRGWSS